MWIAESEDLFAAAGLDASVQTFQSAQELSTALASGAVEMAMTDIMVSATLCASGTPVRIEWITLGADREQGRFGIMANPESGYTTLKELAGVPIGVGSCTVPEYVMDKLMEEAGVPQEQIVGEEIKKVPVRYEMMVAGQVAAAALPGSLLALGEATGMVLVADDRGSANLSQSVMIAREPFADSSEGAAALAALARIWDEAANGVNANPEAYRALLVEKAQLPKPVWDSYPISTYPLAQMPSAQMIDPVLDWMLEKGYLKQPLTYDAATGVFQL
jgi:NitT/TauT family transport system substrate-binding protein